MTEAVEKVEYPDDTEGFKYFHIYQPVSYSYLKNLFYTVEYVNNVPYRVYEDSDGDKIYIHPHNIKELEEVMKLVIE